MISRRALLDRQDAAIVPGPSRATSAQPDPMHLPTPDDEINSPHATLFARLFRDPGLAWVTVTSLVPELSTLLLEPSLRLADGHLIDDRLQDRFADLLFEARLVNEREALIRLLFEHRSRAEPLTPLAGALPLGRGVAARPRGARPPCAGTADADPAGGGPPRLGPPHVPCAFLRALRGSAGSVGARLAASAGLPDPRG